MVVLSITCMKYTKTFLPDRRHVVGDRLIIYYVMCSDGVHS